MSNSDTLWDRAVDRLMISVIREDMRRTNTIVEIDDGDILMTIVDIESPIVVLPSIFLRRQAG